MLGSLLGRRELLDALNVKLGRVCGSSSSGKCDGIVSSLIAFFRRVFGDAVPLFYTWLGFSVLLFRCYCCVYRVSHDGVERCMLVEGWTGMGVKTSVL